MILRTYVDSWRLVKTVASGSEDSTITTYKINTFAKDIDLLSPDKGGVSATTSANASCFKFLGVNSDDTGAGSATVSLYGGSDQGSREHIATLTLTFSDPSGASEAVEDATTHTYWADTITTASTHYATVTIADSGNARPCRVKFDNTGMRYIDVVISATSGLASVSAYHKTY